MSAASSSAPDAAPSAAVGEESRKEAEDVVVQYVVLRRDLADAWPLGSVVAQGCHAAVAAVWAHRDRPDPAAYCAPDNLEPGMCWRARFDGIGPRLLPKIAAARRIGRSVERRPGSPLDRTRWPAQRPNGPP